MFQPGDLFELANRIEERGRRFYELMSHEAPTPRSRQLFERLAREEAAHGREFERITEESLAMPFEIPDGYASPELLAYLEVMHEGRGSPDEAGVNGVSMRTEAEALMLAVTYEKDAILLLHEIYDVMPPSLASRKALAELIRSEKGQLARICGVIAGKAR